MFFWAVRTLWFFFVFVTNLWNDSQVITRFKKFKKKIIINLDCENEKKDEMFDLKNLQCLCFIEIRIKPDLKSWKLIKNVFTSNYECLYNIHIKY